MVKGKYLVSIFIVYYQLNSFANSWLVDKGKILNINSLEISNHLDNKISNSTAKYYEIANEIEDLYAFKERIVSDPYFIDPNDLQAFALRLNSKKVIERHNKNIIQEVNNKINELKNLQRKYRPFYKCIQFSNYIELGATYNISIFSNILVNILDNSFFTNRINNKEGTKLLFSIIDLGAKFKLYQTDNYMISAHNIVTLMKTNNIFYGVKLSLAKQKSNKIGSRIHSFEIGVSVPVKYSDDYMKNKLDIKFNYSSINKFDKYQFMILGQQFYNFYPYEHQYNKLLIRNKLSIVKNLSSIKDNYDCAIEFGFYNDLSSSKFRLVDKGILVALWKNF